MSTGPIGGGIQRGALTPPTPNAVSAGAPSRVASTPTNGPSGTRPAEANPRLAFGLPGHSPNQSVNGGTRLAGAISSGPQQTAGFGAQIGAGGSNTPFIPLDSTKLGLEGLGAAFAGAGEALGALLQQAAKGGQNGGGAGGGGSQGQNAGSGGGGEGEYASTAGNIGGSEQFAASSSGADGQLAASTETMTGDSIDIGMESVDAEAYAMAEQPIDIPADDLADDLMADAGDQWA